MGYGQFMLFFYKEYVVDFNGDGYINLWDLVDVIGSVVNYFKVYGWVKGDMVVVLVNGQVLGLVNGFKIKYSFFQFVVVGLMLQ